MIRRKNEKQPHPKPDRRIYVRPELEELGDMAKVTQKSGSIPDQGGEPGFFEF